MATVRAENATPSPQAAIPALWASLGRRQIAELALPGATIGLLGGVIAGVMAAVGGLTLGVTLIAAVALALPLALGGAGYDLLVARGRIPLGPLAPVAIYWAVAFPVARIIHASIVNVSAGDRVAVPHGWLDFVVYQMLLSVGFAIGFWWLHQNLAPRWWFRLRDRNPVASHFMHQQLQFVHWLHEERQQQRQERQQQRRERKQRRGRRR